MRILGLKSRIIVSLLISCECIRVRYIVDCTVRVVTDNSTVIAYLRKQGGTRSPHLAALTWKILIDCQQRHITLRVRHIPGKLNILADSLSRVIVPTEWSIHPEVLKRIFRKWGKPMIDLFATSQNFKLPLYVSPVPDAAAVAVDAMSMDWDNLHGYAFPPSPMMPKVMEKIRTSTCQLIVIAPYWPKQSWFSSLLENLIDLPLQIPYMRQLLRQDGQFHKWPEVFNLHAWKVSSDSQLQEAFLQRQPYMRPTISEDQVQPCTTGAGVSSVIGVVRNKLIHSVQL